MEAELQGVRFEIRQGDITGMDTDAIVNAANNQDRLRAFFGRTEGSFSIGARERSKWKEIIMFCPTCGSEYVQGIGKCSDCGATLVAELPRFDDSDEPLRMIRIVGPTEGPMIEELLENNEIDCILQGEISAATIPTGGDMTEVRVWVRESDQERAGQIIDAFFKGMAGGEEEEEEEEEEQDTL